MRRRPGAWAFVAAAAWWYGTASAGGSPPGEESWLFPGEYESHQAMWMLWPVFENKAGFPSTDPISEMIRALNGHTHVNLAVQDEVDEAGARDLLRAKHVPLDHVHFFRLEHGDIWARDMGPQFTRSDSGKLRINDWSFNMWGQEEPESPNSTFEEPFDRTVAATIGVPVLTARTGPTGARMIHEGGSTSHNGRGTMILVESVVMQRNLGPNRFCGGAAPVTDYDSPNTYAPNADWPACKARVENEYRRMLGAKKFIWIPTGVIEDNGTFRGALAKHIHVPTLDGETIPHAGVYTLFVTNGHTDEVARFVDERTVLLAEQSVPQTVPRTPAEKLIRWLEEQNAERLGRAYTILSRATNESGEPIRILRIPTPAHTLEVFRPGDGIYDYFAAYDRWEDGSTLPEVMLGVWPASYVNYVPTNDIVLLAKYASPGGGLERRQRDTDAVAAIEKAFPGRKVVQIRIENVNRGGGGMNCITQQQPASSRFVSRCGWSKVQVDTSVAKLYAAPTGGATVGMVARLTRYDEDIYLKRLTTFGRRVRVQIEAPTRQDDVIAWVNEEDIESAGEKCSRAYSLN